MHDLYGNNQECDFIWKNDQFRNESNSDLNNNESSKDARIAFDLMPFFVWNWVKFCVFEHNYRLFNL